MIQFNLLPDIKKEYIKAKKTKRLIMSISVMVIIGSLAIVSFLFVIVQVLQKNNIEDLSTDINAEISSIESIPGLEKILTVQNQLGNLQPLHEGKPLASKLFAYFGLLKPSDVKISNLEINYVDNTMKIEGEAGSLASVNQFADTLKFAEYSSSESDKINPFTSVITELNRTTEKTRYTITLTFDPIIFNTTSKGILVVPSQITTRSTVNKPDFNPNNLFEQSTEEDQ